MEKLLSWSQQNNLIFNCDKLQSILFSLSRLSSKHNLEDNSLLIRCSGQSIQQKANVKLLGVIFDQHLTWTDQINNIIRSNRDTLWVLWKFSRFTTMKVRKTAEALIISKLIIVMWFIVNCLSIWSIGFSEYKTNCRWRIWTVCQNAWCNQFKLATYWEKYRNEHC